MNKIVNVFFAVILFSCTSNKEEANKNNDKVDDKETVLKKALKQHPDSLALLQNLVTIYLERQHFDDAYGIVNTALTKDSINPMLWDIKSIIAVQKGDTILAIKSLEKAVEIFPNPDYIISLGALYAETNNASALEMADALLMAEKAHAEPQAFFIKGLYYSYKNEKEKSILFFDKAIAADYHFMDAYLEKGIALYDLHQYQDATNILAKAIKVKQDYTQGYYYLGKCYEKLNRTEEAIEVYQAAVQLDPDYDEAKDALSRMGVK